MNELKMLNEKLNSIILSEGAYDNKRVFKAGIPPE